MKYALIKDNIVVQVQPNKQAGFIEVADSVVCGMIMDGDNFITPPAPEKSIQQKIYDLENSVTPRNYREFVLGVKYSIDKINKVDADIELLRKGL